MVNLTEEEVAKIVKESSVPQPEYENYVKEKEKPTDELPNLKEMNRLKLLKEQQKNRLEKEQLNEEIRAIEKEESKGNTRRWIEKTAKKVGSGVIKSVKNFDAQRNKTINKQTSGGNVRRGYKEYRRQSKPSRQEKSMLNIKTTSQRMNSTDFGSTLSSGMSNYPNQTRQRSMNVNDFGAMLSGSGMKVNPNWLGGSITPKKPKKGSGMQINTNWLGLGKPSKKKKGGLW
jgi:hypothetical protein